MRRKRNFKDKGFFLYGLQAVKYDQVTDKL